MKNKILSFLLLAIIVGCKNEPANILFTQDDIDNLFNLNNYQTNQQQKINDSIFQYIGENERFLIKGKYNYLKKYKAGWWSVYDKKNREKYLDIQFFIEYEG
ncbi:hypothetical protein [Chryseobacterium sp. CT-SW4]|uniref:hypothetical protein n=1 Tax=Chryseobacterium sp. SW-1 TaxID=3157343 RepID=UPI003B02275F